VLRTIDEACDFIGEWCDEPSAHPAAPVATPFEVPGCVLRLSARFGELWRSAKRIPGPFLEYPTPFLGLLEGQDRILDPSLYAIDANGVVPFICENQGVWRYGFRPGEVDRLLVSGDWCDGLRGDFTTEWRHAQATTEDALICTLLINMCMQSNADWDQDAPRPEAAHLVLWRHAAWSDFDGFWTNEERTLIYFSGWRVTRR
jgi:hypothetical protein